jgi:hypothetical protein
MLSLFAVIEAIVSENNDETLLGPQFMQDTQRTV